MLAAHTKAAVTDVPPISPAKASPGWKEIVEPVGPFVEQVAARLAAQVELFEPEIHAFARYALTNQGKQLRPALVALSGGASGRICDALVEVAVIIEMVHLATLVHDDVVDEAEIRRCRPTLAANWGNEVSVLLGDCLFAHALKMAAGFPTTEVCRAVSAATNTVCSGEILQTLRRGELELSRAEYFKILEMKTAELFALSCDLGAGLAGATEADRQALREYGLMLGTAYQVFDDCVDLFGLESAAGKSLGTDLARGKITLPVLVAIERATAAERKSLKHTIQTWEQRHLGEVLDLLAKYSALAESQKVIHQFLAAARQSLKRLKPTNYRLALVRLTDFLEQQTGAFGVQS